RSLREADRRKDEFLALLGHELRNPLAPIGLALETLRSRELPDPDARNARDVIARQVKHMTRLVSDLLDVSRLTRGAVTQRLAHRHGGSLEAYSEGRNRGSEFSLKLQAVDDAPAPRPATPVEVDVRSFRLKILIIDDNVDAAQALASLLSRWGHETQTVHDGEAGLAAVARFASDVVLLGLDLPQI